MTTVAEKNIDTGGPAFPGPEIDDGIPMEAGMTLRDYFAAKAMQAGYNELLTSAHRSAAEYMLLNVDEVAQHAYRMADAMIAARKK